MGRITAGAGSTVLAQKLRMQYMAARFALLVAIVFSVLNCIFTFFQGLFYTPFSFTFPQAMIDNARFLTGQMFTLEEYMQVYGMTQNDFLAPEFMLVDGGLALLAVAVLVVCWALSKKYVGAMIAAAALLVADLLFEVYWYDVELAYLSEYVMPALLLAILIFGIVAHFRVRYMEWLEEESAPAYALPASQDADGIPADSPVLHPMDYGAKGKVLMACDVQGYFLCYRRVGTFCELAINKMVYDTVYAGKYVQPHVLGARVEGHDFEVGLQVDGGVYVRFDGVVVRKTK